MNEDVETEWINITNIIKQTGYESLGTKKKWLRRKGLRNWNDNIEKIVNDKREAYKKFLNSRKEVDKIEYKLKRAITKREVCKYHRKNWEKFVSFLENDIT